MNKVFVYGTLKRNGRLNDYLDDSEFKAEATVDNMDMYSNGPYPMIVPGLGQVHGEVWECNDYTMYTLDGLEAEGSMYLRERRTTTDGDEVWVYIWNLGLDRLEPISDGCFKEKKFEWVDEGWDD